MLADADLASTALRSSSMSKNPSTSLRPEILLGALRAGDERSRPARSMRIREGTKIRKGNVAGGKRRIEDMPCGLGGKTPPASGHRDDIDRRDRLAFAPGLDADVIIIEENDRNAVELEAMGDRQPVMTVHDEEFVLVNGDGLRPSLHAENLALEVVRTLGIDILSCNEAGKIQKAA